LKCTYGFLCTTLWENQYLFAHFIHQRQLVLSFTHFPRAGFDSGAKQKAISWHKSVENNRESASEREKEKQGSREGVQ